MVEVSASGFPSKCVGNLSLGQKNRKGQTLVFSPRLDPSEEAITLSFHVHVRERHNGLSRDRASKGLGRSENREQQSAVQLLPHLFVIPAGNNAIVFHSPAGIHIGLN